MKSRIKTLLAASLMSVLLAACGSSGGSEEPLATDPPVTPQEQAPPLQPVVPEQSVVPQEPQEPQQPQDPQEPVVPPLPVPGQTGWSLQGIESRTPLELLKSAVCVGRAQLASVAAPRSSEACSIAFPEVVSGGELTLPGIEIPPAAVLEPREGCTFASDYQMLLCSWKFAQPDPRDSASIVNYWLAAPFQPSFSSGIESCEAGKDHWFPATLGVRGVDANGPTVKAPAYPAGCVGWEEMTDFFELQGVYLESDSASESD